MGIFPGAWCAIAVVHMAAEGESTVTGAHEELESDGEGIFCHSSTLTLILSIGFGVAVMEFSEPATA